MNGEQAYRIKQLHHRVIDKMDDEAERSSSLTQEQVGDATRAQADFLVEFSILISHQIREPR